MLVSGFLEPYKYNKTNMLKLKKIIIYLSTFFTSFFISIIGTSEHIQDHTLKNQKSFTELNLLNSVHADAPRRGDGGGDGGSTPADRGHGDYGGGRGGGGGFGGDSGSGGSGNGAGDGDDFP